jgi:hypothetical protein
MNAATALGLVSVGSLGPMLLLGLVALVVARPLVRRYLDRRFGVVRQPASVLPVVLLVAVSVAQLSMMVFGAGRDVSTPALALASGYVTWRDFRLRKHWLLPTLVCTLLSLQLPIIPTSRDVHAQVVFSARMALIAAAFCIAHLLDHRALLNAFSSDRQA